MTLGSLALLTDINRLAGLMAAAIAIFYIAIIYRTGPIIARAYKHASDETAAQAAYLYQLIRGLLDIRTFDVRGAFSAKYGEKAQAKANAMIAAGWLSKRIDQSAYVAQLVGSVVVVVVALKLSGTRSIGISGGIAAMGVLALFWGGVRNAVAQFVGLQKRLPLVARLNEWLAVPVEYGQDCGSHTRGAPGSASAAGLIAFRNVSFRFPGMDREILDHASFDVGAGEIVLVSGENGVGKTTLMLLIPMALTYDEGFGR